MPKCPPDHLPYLSEMLAANAATLHSFIHPGCPGIDTFECGDHWHIGHSKINKAECPTGTRPQYPRLHRIRKRKKA